MLGFIGVRGALGDVGAKLECAGEVGSQSSSGIDDLCGASAVGTGGSSPRCRVVHHLLPARVRRLGVLFCFCHLSRCEVA